MSDLSVDVTWFKKHIDEWEEFRLHLSQAWGRSDGYGTDLPDMHERMPDDLKAVVPKLAQAKTTVSDNFEKGAGVARRYTELLHETATAYINTEASNQDEIDALTRELDG